MQKIMKFIATLLIFFSLSSINSQNYHYNFLNDTTYENKFSLSMLEKYKNRSIKANLNTKKLFLSRFCKPDISDENFNNMLDSIIYLVNSKSGTLPIEYPFVKYRYKYIGEIESINGFRNFILLAYYKDNSPLERHKEANLFLFIANKDFYLTSAVRIGEYYKLRSISYHYGYTNTNISSNIIDITKKSIAIAKDICHNRKACSRKDNTYYFNYKYKINEDGSVNLYEMKSLNQ